MQATDFIEMILMVTADHGAAVSGAHNTIVTARAGKDLVSALCSGLLTIGPRFGGALDDTAKVCSVLCSSLLLSSSRLLVSRVTGVPQRSGQIADASAVRSGDAEEERADSRHWPQGEVSSEPRRSSDHSD